MAIRCTIYLLYKLYLFCISINRKHKEQSPNDKTVVCPLDFVLYGLCLLITMGVRWNWSQPTNVHFISQSMKSFKYVPLSCFQLSGT